MYLYLSVNDPDVHALKYDVVPLMRSRVIRFTWHQERHALDTLVHEAHLWLGNNRVPIPNRSYCSLFIACHWCMCHSPLITMPHNVNTTMLHQHCMFAICPCLFCLMPHNIVTTLFCWCTLTDFLVTPEMLSQNLSNRESQLTFMQ